MTEFLMSIAWEIHPRCRVSYVLFILVLLGIQLYKHVFFHTISDGHLDYFHLGPTVKDDN